VSVKEEFRKNSYRQISQPFSTRYNTACFESGEKNGMVKKIEKKCFQGKRPLWANTMKSTLLKVTMHIYRSTYLALQQAVHNHWYSQCVLY